MLETYLETYLDPSPLFLLDLGENIGDLFLLLFGDRYFYNY
jgi:hypothetical protein